MLQGLPNQTFQSPMELIETVDGLACKPTRPLRAPFGKCLPPIHWKMNVETIREQLLQRAPNWGLTIDEMRENIDCDLHFSPTFSPLIYSMMTNTTTMNVSTITTTSSDKIITNFIMNDAIINTTNTMMDDEKVIDKIQLKPHNSSSSSSCSSSIQSIHDENSDSINDSERIDSTTTTTITTTTTPTSFSNNSNSTLAIIDLTINDDVDVDDPITFQSSSLTTTKTTKTHEKSATNIHNDNVICVVDSGKNDDHLEHDTINDDDPLQRHLDRLNLFISSSSSLNSNVNKTMITAHFCSSIYTMSIPSSTKTTTTLDDSLIPNSQRIFYVK